MQRLGHTLRHLKQRAHASRNSSSGSAPGGRKVKPVRVRCRQPPKRNARSAIKPRDERARWPFGQRIAGLPIWKRSPCQYYCRPQEIFSIRAASFLKSAWPLTGSKARWLTPLTSQRLRAGSAESATDRFHGLEHIALGHGIARRLDLGIEADRGPRFVIAAPGHDPHPIAVLDAEFFGVVGMHLEIHLGNEAAGGPTANGLGGVEMLVDHAEAEPEGIFVVGDLRPLLAAEIFVGKLGGQPLVAGPGPARRSGR